MNEAALVVISGVMGILIKAVFDYLRGTGAVKKEVAEAGVIHQKAADDAESRYSRDLTRQANRIDELEKRSDGLSKRLSESEDERRKERRQLSDELFLARDQITALQKQVYNATQDRVRLDKAETLITDLQTRLDQEHAWRLAAEKRVAELEAQIAKLLGAGKNPAEAP